MEYRQIEKNEETKSGVYSLLKSAQELGDLPIETIRIGGKSYAIGKYERPIDLGNNVGNMSYRCGNYSDSSEIRINMKLPTGLRLGEYKKLIRNFQKEAGPSLVEGIYRWGGPQAFHYTV